MAILYLCDGCGKQSPDQTGTCQHSQWTSVEYVIRTRAGERIQSALFCERCLPVQEEGRIVSALLTRIKIFQERKKWHEN